MRIKLIVEYDGTAYSGWQRQKNAPSIQQTLEEAFFSLTGEKVVIQGAGRTDAGVHALGQTAHFDTECTIPPEKIVFALNTKLPPDIRVRESSMVHPRFHSTIDAKKKHYRYVVYNAKHANAILNRYSAHVYYPLDIEKMKRAAASLIGEHDFAAYSSAGSDIKTTVRTIFSIDISKQGDYILIDVVGNGFLYNMVRIISGTLCDIGTGRLPESAAKEALLTKDRKKAGQTMPPQGLTMMEVFY